MEKLLIHKYKTVCGKISNNYENIAVVDSKLTYFKLWLIYSVNNTVLRKGGIITCETSMVLNCSILEFDIERCLIVHSLTKASPYNLLCYTTT